jgi:hypothetical protein
MATHARKTQIVARHKPVTQSPKFLKLQARVSNVAKRAHAGAARQENVMLVLAGAAVPALYSKLTGRALPSLGGIDPELILGGLLMAGATMTSGKTGHRLLALGTGCAAPAINRAIKAGSIKVGEDDESGADDSI